MTDELTMEISVDPEFVVICKEIINTGLTLDEWHANESDDGIQTEHYCGGFDGIEEAFCFSYYDSEKKEWWFQLSLDEVEQVVSGKLTMISIRPAYA